VSTTTGSPRAACIVIGDDLVRLGGEQHAVDAVRDMFDGTAAAPHVVLRFTSGHPPLRIHAGAQLDVERPGPTRHNP
jgi:hypothetical protein